MAKLRRLRLSRISLSRKFLRRKVKKEWCASYILLENGDYFFIPDNIDAHCIRLLLKPFQHPVIISKFCKTGTTVIDIGANIGEWSLPMARSIGEEGRLISFEPIPYLCDSVNKTFRINGIFHARCFPIAISNKIGNAKLFMNCGKEEILNIGASSIEGPPSENSTTIEVQTATLDEFISIHKVDRISFIKIDVEGHEYAVIEGAVQTLSTHRPVLTIEVGNESSEKRELISDILKRLNYEMIGIVADHGIIPADYENLIKFNYPFSTEKGRVVNVLFIPVQEGVRSI